MDWQVIENNISAATGERFKLDMHHNVAGGCINSAMKISGAQHTYMLKFNQASMLSMFEAEADGLIELRASESLRIPNPICTGTVDSQSYIVMEYIDMGGTADMSAFAEQLAAMHRHTQSQFGWHRDNTIGSIQQINEHESSWITFWREHRLGFQLELAKRNGLSSSALSKGEKLKEGLEHFFSSYVPKASLLHGDLWSGNYGFSMNGEAVIYDPAVYFGDREADMAMTELFGGFGQDFYAAYDNAWPLDDGYVVRKTLYNLYHILNHFNMFGGGYASQATGMIEQLVAEL